MGSRRRTYSRSPRKSSHRADSKRHSVASDVDKIDWENENLSNITKNIYIPSNSQQINDKLEKQKFLESNDISVSDDLEFNPVSDFEEITFPDSISEKIKSLKWSKPYPLESVTWPLILSGKNVNIRAHTGAGKSVSLLFPLIMHTLANLTSNTKRSGPISLILVPTREISEHFEYIIKMFINSTELTVSSLSGGVSRSAQRESIESSNPQILVSTPGRLLDFVESKYLSLKFCSMLAVYECDKMLEMGFISAMKSIASFIRPDRQTILLSTKKHNDFEKFSSKVTESSITVTIDHYKLVTKQVNVKQSFEVLTPAKKFDRLVYVLKRIDKLQCFILVENQRIADTLKERLRDRNYYVGSIHVDKTPKERFVSLEKLKSGSFDVIISTETACRGLDINDISCYINYDYPSYIEEYVNRLARISKSKSKVECINFYHTRNGSLAKSLIKLLEDCKQKVSDDLLRISKEGYQSENRRRAPSHSKSRTRSPSLKKHRGRSYDSKSNSESGSSRSRSRTGTKSHKSRSRSSSKRSYSSASSVVNGKRSSKHSRSSSRSSNNEDSNKGLNNGTSVITKKVNSPVEKVPERKSRSPATPKSKSVSTKSSRNSSKSSQKSESSKASNSKSKSSSSRSGSSHKNSRKCSRSSTKSSRSDRSIKRSNRDNSSSRSGSRNFRRPRYGYMSRRASRSNSRRRRSPSPRRRFQPASKRYSRRNSPVYRRRTPSYRRRTPSYQKRSYRRQNSPPRSRYRSRSNHTKSRSSSYTPKKTGSRQIRDHSSRSSSRVIKHERSKSPIKQRSISIKSNRSVSPPSSHVPEKETSNQKLKSGEKSLKKPSDDEGDQSECEAGRGSDKSKKKKKKKSKKAKKAKKEKKAKKRALEGGEDKKSKKKKKKASS